jgi:hypothetical protein
MAAMVIVVLSVVLRFEVVCLDLVNLDRMISCQLGQDDAEDVESIV